MYLHPELDIAFGGEPKCGSRKVRDELKRRGFICVGGHHDSPSDILGKPREDVPNADIWYGNKKITYFSVVRNPFDAVLSWLWASIYRGRFKVMGVPEVNLLFAAKRYRVHFPNPHNFFKHLYVQPRCATLRFETLKDDLNHVFERYGLGKIGDWIENKQYMSRDRPRGPGSWRPYWDPEAVLWFSDKFRKELDFFGYTF